MACDRELNVKFAMTMILLTGQYDNKLLITLSTSS